MVASTRQASLGLAVRSLPKTGGGSRAWPPPGHRQPQGRLALLASTRAPNRVRHTPNG